MPSSKDCFKLLKDFDEHDIAELEDRATKLAGDEPVTNATYLAAAHDLHREYSERHAASPAPAAKQVDLTSYPYNITDKEVLRDEMGMLPQKLYDEFEDKHGDALERNDPKAIRAAQDLLAEHGIDTSEPAPVVQQESKPAPAKAVDTTPGKVGARTVEPVTAKAGPGYTASDVVKQNKTERDVERPEQDNRDPHQEEASRVQKGVEGKTPLQVARWIAENAPNESYRVIAESVGRKLMQLINAGVQLDLKVAHLGDRVPRSLTGSRGLSHYKFGNAQKGEKSSITVWLNGADVIGKVGMSYETVLHELVHMALQPSTRLGNLRVAEGTAVAAATTRLYAVTNAIIKEFNQRVEASKNGGAELSPFEKEMFSRQNNAFADVQETLAWALTNKDAQQFLESISYKSNVSLWDAFVNAVRNFLGLAPKAETALSEVLGAASQLFDAPVNELQELAGKTGTAMQTVAGEEVNTSGEEISPQVRASGANAMTGLPEFEGDVGFKAKGERMLKEVSRGWKSFPAMLGFLTNRQLKDRFASAHPLVGEVVDLVGQMATKAKHLMQETRPIFQSWQKLDDKTATEMHKLMLESTINEMHLIDPTADRIIPVTFGDKINGHLEDTPSNRAKFAALQSRFTSMDAAAQKIYLDAQRKAAKDWKERGELLGSRIVDQYRSDLHAIRDLDKVARTPERQRPGVMRDLGLSPNARRALVSLWSDMDAHAQTLAELRGPYFPLMRFGDHVVVAKSGKFLEAEKAYKSAVEKLNSLADSDTSTEDELAAARAEVKTTRSAVADLKNSNANEYVVEFYEKPTQASDRANQLRKFFEDSGAPDTEVYSQMRNQYFGKIDGVTPAFMNKLEGALSANLSDKDAGAVRAAVRDIYIQAMPERSALKQQLQRLGVAGAKVSEVQRAFAASSMRNAWHLSRLEYNLAMHDKLTELRTSGTDDAKLIGNELAKRFVQEMTFDEGNGLASWLANASYLTYLGLSPSFFVLNAAQPWTISLPVMAGRFGMGAPAAELYKAFTEVGGAMRSSMKDQKTWRFELDLTKFKDEQERNMLSQLFDKGVIDVTIEHDLGSIASGDSESAWGKTLQFASLPAHHTEVVNRVMTALAAYRLDKKHSAKQGTTGAAAERKATDYAERIVAETHLDYSPENAPRLMRPGMFGGFGRVVFQFKKYIQGMIFLWSKNLIDASRGDKEAAKSVGYLTGMMVGVAGTTGLPIAGVLGVLGRMLSKAWDDDDEPDFGALIYAGMKDAVGETAARALWKGLPAAVGVDLSNRIGQGQLLNPMAFAKDQGKEGGDWVAANLFALAGPAPSMVANWADAAVLAKSDPLKAAQMATPKVVGDVLRAIDRADRGVASRKGDTLISPDEFGPLGVAMRAVGFESTDVTDMYERRTSFNEAKANRDDARKAIIAEFVKARQSGESPDSLLDQVRGYNERHPDERITQSHLQQAVVKSRRQASELSNGLRIQKRDRGLAEQFE